MPAAHPLPETGSIYLDARGADRALRVSWHQEADVVVLSLWRDNLCTGSFRLAVEEVPDLIDLLRRGLAQSYAAVRRPVAADQRDPRSRSDDTAVRPRVVNG